MCSIILRISPEGSFIAANRDEILNRPWEPPASYWPEQPDVTAGRDSLAGGTWLGMNRTGVMAAVLNRHGSLGPAPGKTSRGELPLIALLADTAADAAQNIAALDAGRYRSFNVVVADKNTAYFLKGLEIGKPKLEQLEPGIWMITSTEPNDPADPRIARHLPAFRNAAWPQWGQLLADNTGPAASALNIPPQNGYGTSSSSLIALTQNAEPSWLFAAGPPDQAAFSPVNFF